MRLIASKNNIDASVGSVLNLETESSVNLKPYLAGEGYTIDVTAKTDETTNQEIEIASDMIFKVTADVF